MLTRIIKFLLFIPFCTMVWLGINIASAQDSVAELDNNLPGKAVFVDADLTALEDGQPVVKLLPVQYKREVAACGLVRLQVQPEVFLQSFFESMVPKEQSRYS